MSYTKLTTKGDAPIRADDMLREWRGKQLTFSDKAKLALEASKLHVRCYEEDPDADAAGYEGWWIHCYNGGAWLVPLSVARSFDAIPIYYLPRGASFKDMQSSFRKDNVSVNELSGCREWLLSNFYCMRCG